MNRIPAPWVNFPSVTLALLICSVGASAQLAGNNRSSAELNQHLDELTGKLDSMRQQLIDSQKEMDELRGELRSLREQLAEKDQTAVAARDASTLESSIAQIRDESEVLQAEVKQQDQSKVESTSKYPVRLNGTVLITSVFNTRNPDDVNLPIVALPIQANTLSGSLSATASQTVLGLDASGPHLGSAKSFADLSVDFWGGTPSAYGASTGNIRMRTAHARIEWPTRSITFARDRPLISPWQPTSWVSVAEPALSWSGNLWTWSPQFELEQKHLFLSRLNANFGLIFPVSPSTYTMGQTSAASATERSRQPGYEGRLGWASSWRDRPFNLGASGYYSRQAYTYDGHVDAWAAAGDWMIPAGPFLQLSGEIYRGRAIGGLGGGAFKDVVTQQANDSIRGLNAAGGWAQAKFTLTRSMEANVSAGLDDAFSADLRNSDQAAGEDYYASLARNQTVLANFVYRPRTYLVFSTEFRQINSRSVLGHSWQDRVVGIATGYIF